MQESFIFHISLYSYLFIYVIVDVLSVFIDVQEYLTVTDKAKGVVVIHNGDGIYNKMFFSILITFLPLLAFTFETYSKFTKQINL